jgi:hypothetical protein
MGVSAEGGKWCLSAERMIPVVRYSVTVFRGCVTPIQPTKPPEPPAPGSWMTVDRSRDWAELFLVSQRRRTYIASNASPQMSISRGIEILEGALAIGRQADPLGLSMVAERMSAVKETATSISDNVPTWLEGLMPS